MFAFNKPLHCLPREITIKYHYSTNVSRWLNYIFPLIHYSRMSSLAFRGQGDKRTYAQEQAFIKHCGGVQYEIQKGFVENMKVPVKFYVNNKLKPLIYDELKNHCSRGANVGGVSILQLNFYFFPFCSTNNHCAPYPFLVFACC